MLRHWTPSDARRDGAHGQVRAGVGARRSFLLLALRSVRRGHEMGERFRRGEANVNDETQSDVIVNSSFAADVDRLG